MDFTHVSYSALVTLAGGVARGLRRALPEGWRLRLEAKPPADLPAGAWIWLHAVSVGELLLVEGLLGRLLETGHRVHLTTGTTAGMALLEERLPRWQGDSGLLTGGAFPLDDRAGLSAFLAAPPALFIALETELWPNLLRTLRLRGTPSVVVNGRLTERSRGPFVGSAIRDLSLVVARDEPSADAFRVRGAQRVEWGGNLKADLPPPAPLHEGWDLLRKGWAGDPILVVGNTVEDEEALILQMWPALVAAHPRLKLILAPRQPRRFDEVSALFVSKELAFHRASSDWSRVEDWASTQALLLDTLGELPRAYGEGTAALVGGGWRSRGGHNPLEPARFGMPVLIGPGYTNFEDLVAPLLACSALEVVEEFQLAERIRAAIAKAPLRPLHSPDHPPEHLASLLGALDRTWRFLEPLLPSGVATD